MKLCIEHSTTCDSRTHLNYVTWLAHKGQRLMCVALCAVLQSTLWVWEIYPMLVTEIRSCSVTRTQVFEHPRKKSPVDIKMKLSFYFGWSLYYFTKSGYFGWSVVVLPYPLFYLLTYVFLLCCVCYSQYARHNESFAKFTWTLTSNFASTWFPFVTFLLTGCDASFVYLSVISDRILQ